MYIYICKNGYVCICMYVCLNTFIYDICVYMCMCVCMYRFTTYQGNYCRLLLGYICFPFSLLSWCALPQCSKLVAHQKSSLLFTQSKLIT